jgi:hypothetical protein
MNNISYIDICNIILVMEKNNKFPAVSTTIVVVATIVLILTAANVTPLAAFAYKLKVPRSSDTDAGVSVMSLLQSMAGVKPQTNLKLPTGLGGAIGAGVVAPINRNIAALGDKWWNWVSSIDTTKVGGNPFDDTTGELCGLGKQQGNLLFLVGTVGELTNTTSGETLGHTGDVRTCDTPIPRGTSIFFPLVNTECSAYETIHFGCAPLPSCPKTDNWSVDQLRACAIDIINHVDKNSLTLKIDGVSLDNLVKRVQSGPGGFQLTIVPNNAPGINVTDTTTTTSVSDGYWALLKATTLRPGVLHTITFGGEIDFPEFNTIFKTEVTYKIVVK